MASTQVKIYVITVALCGRVKVQLVQGLIDEPVDAAHDDPLLPAPVHRLHPDVERRLELNLDEVTF